MQTYQNILKDQMQSNPEFQFKILVTCVQFFNKVNRIYETDLVGIALNCVAYALNNSLFTQGLVMSRVCLLLMIKTIDSALYMEELISQLIELIKNSQGQIQQAECLCLAQNESAFFSHYEEDANITNSPDATTILERLIVLLVRRSRLIINLKEKSLLDELMHNRYVETILHIMKTTRTQPILSKFKDLFSVAHLLFALQEEEKITTFEGKTRSRTRTAQRVLLRLRLPLHLAAVLLLSSSTPALQAHALSGRASASQSLP